MKKLFIYCAGGVGREVCDIAERINTQSPKWEEICFIDDTINADSFYGKKLFSYNNFQKIFSPESAIIVIANGEPASRETLSSKVISDGYRLASVIDYSAVISPSARLGKGIIIYPFVCVSSNVQINNNTLIYNHSTVAHNSVIGNNTVLSIGATIAGNCSVSDNCFIGAGAVIRENVQIGSWSIIAMGSVVSHSLPPNGIYMGNPAKMKKENINRKVFN
ncbi:UDP-N-acetylbacillosamine N-acetyltransferase [Desulfosporosinus acididurans]|uniref:UDP-N-acetylbacillosamine N-acetyltransferase n=1 Tax=Desulfosporosinus acididurans TaxID=476652 RepID=A0A0J1FN18_9FIRM|nr:acetyltransferase [Desulfosporosinus acididurans]KLU64358.1 UDP-N-acetylbacillosamine N-acetyltransferase [Desulfosporosinus acididurans]